MRRLIALVLVMTTPVRMLFGAGAGPFTTPPAASAFEVAASPNGGWPGAQVTNAIWYNGWTYISSIDGSGNLEIRALQDGQTVPVTTLLAPHSDWIEIDWHDAPALIVRNSDHKLVAVYCRHAAGANMYRSISTTSLDTDPDLSDGFGAGTDIAGSIGGTEFTYPRLYQLSAEADLMYLFWRSYISSKSTLLMSTSTDGGVTWSTRTAVFQQNSEAYWSIDSDGVSRLDFGVADGTGGTSSVYHFYYEGGSFFETDGTTIGGSLPLGTADITLAYNGSPDGARYVGSTAGNGGLPVIVFPAGSTGMNIYASWSGSAWSHHDIVAQGHSGDPWVDGGVVLDLDDPTRVYLSVYSASQWQVFLKRTTDAGVSFSSTQITFGSNASIYPNTVRGHGSWVKVVWMNDGTASSFTSYAFGIGATGT